MVGLTATNGIEEIAQFPEGVIPRYGWSSDGSSFLFTRRRNGNYDIWLNTLEDRDEVQLTTSSGDDISPRWSPDGSRVVFVSDREEWQQIFIMGKDGSDQRPLVDQTFSWPGIDWSPSGDRIVVVDNYSSDVYELTLGNSKPRLLNDSFRGVVKEPAWSPDGSRIAVLFLDLEPLASIVTLDPTSGEARAVTPVPVRADTSFSWSPDGKRIAFVSDNDIYVVEVTKPDLVSRLTQTPEVECAPSWSPDGQLLAFHRRPEYCSDGPSQVFVMGVNGSEPFLVGEGMNPGWIPPEQPEEHLSPAPPHD